MVMVIVFVAVVDWLPLLLPWPFARCRFLAACVWMPMLPLVCVYVLLCVVAAFASAPRCRLDASASPRCRLLLL